MTNLIVNQKEAVLKQIKIKLNDYIIETKLSHITEKSFGIISKEDDITKNLFNELKSISYRLDFQLHNLYKTCPDCKDLINKYVEDQFRDPSYTINTYREDISFWHDISLCSNDCNSEINELNYWRREFTKLLTDYIFLCQFEKLSFEKILEPIKLNLDIIRKQKDKKIEID